MKMIFKNNHSQIFYKIGVLKNSAKFTRKQKKKHTQGQLKVILRQELLNLRTYKHVLWVPNTQVSLDNAYTQTMNVTQTHTIHTYNVNMYKCTNIHV